MCNKIPYETKQEANSFCVYLRRINKAVKKMHPYFCDDCKKYHLTSRGKAKTRAINKNKKLIKQFEALNNNEDRWKFIAKYQGKWMEVGIYDNRSYVVFNGRIRVIF